MLQWEIGFYNSQGTATGNVLSKKNNTKKKYGYV